MLLQVLAADPDAASLELYRSDLANPGLSVTTVGSRLECYGEHLSCAYDVLILDRALVRDDNCELIGRLRTAPFEPGPPDIPLAGNKSAEVLSADTGFQADQCFQKPFSWKAIHDILTCAVDRTTQAVGTPDK